MTISFGCPMRWMRRRGNQVMITTGSLVPGATRFDRPSAGSLFVGEHVGEDPVTARADETIGYTVIEKGSGTGGGLSTQWTSPRAGSFANDKYGVQLEIHTGHV